jgi:hypothetical protein
MAKSRSVHPSVRELLKEAKSGESAEDIIRRKCRALIARAKVAGLTGPPFDPWHLASFLGFHVEEADAGFPGDGCIFPRGKDVVIQYRSGQLIERQRFTICHEIAHSCFGDAYEYVRHFNAPTPEEKAFFEFENLCNIGASELLFPLEEFQRDMNSAAARLAHSSSLAAAYGASIDATTRRLLDLTTHSCAAVFLTDEAFGDFAALPGRMRIKYYWKSGAFRGHFPKGTLLPKTSRITLTPPALHVDLRTGKEAWWINNRPRSLYVEAVALPKVSNKDYAKVLALVHTRLP